MKRTLRNVELTPIEPCVSSLMSGASRADDEGGRERQRRACASLVASLAEGACEAEAPTNKAPFMASCAPPPSVAPLRGASLPATEAACVRHRRACAPLVGSLTVGVALCDVGAAAAAASRSRVAARSLMHGASRRRCGDCVSVIDERARPLVPSSPRAFRSGRLAAATAAATASGYRRRPGCAPCPKERNANYKSSEWN
jgi:hypothetical protein